GSGRVGGAVVGAGGRHGSFLVTNRPLTRGGVRRPSPPYFCTYDDDTLRLMPEGRNFSRTPESAPPSPGVGGPISPRLWRPWRSSRAARPRWSRAPATAVQS